MDRSIPAWAGEPSFRSALCRATPVYPRVGGGTNIGRVGLAGNHGLSPRGRGNLVERSRIAAEARSIPAWAGEPPSRMSSPAAVSVYPRVGGGTTSTLRRRQAAPGLSPRGRGNPSSVRPHTPCARSIPAWAGEPMLQSTPGDQTAVYPRVGGEPIVLLSHVRLLWVYPRVGGGTVSSTCLAASRLGLSPRGRGNLDLLLAADKTAGSIPAWAGEPTCARSCGSGAPVYPRVGGGTE